MQDYEKYVTYEAFGAVGDGETADMDAIISAHDYANEHLLPVQTRPDATYYIGTAAKTAIIKTDVNWNTSRFTIDDTAVENNRICGSIDWDHPTITELKTFPIDEKPLTLQGGYFTTIANREPSTYNYYARNIAIHRSNVTVDGIVHYVTGEISHGAPYGGFISGSSCAYFTVENCFFTGHKTYITIGRANLPVPMGPYDLHANNVVDFHCSNCRINGITDNTRWGVIATNFCKNIVIEDCIFSRLDAHMGVSGEYTIRNSQLGHQGLNAIGKGLLTVKNTTLYGNSLITFRADYGSIWEGDVVVKNCKWIPACGKECAPHLFDLSNNGMHNFGYPCTMPTNITIDGLYIEDTNTSPDYPGLQLFSDPDGDTWGPQKPIEEPRPYPVYTHQITDDPEHDLCKR